MYTQIRSAAAAVLILTIITGVIYPLLTTALAQTLFPHQANGSLIEQAGQIVGAGPIGQPFDAPRYFWGRPSATAPFAYNAAASAGSNLGPTNDALIAAVQQRIDTLAAADASLGIVNPAPIPADLVTTSASGLDPHISPAAAAYQIPRVALARGLSEDQVRALVTQHTEGRQLGLLGEPRVHVLKLNLALDALQ